MTTYTFAGQNILFSTCAYAIQPQLMISLMDGSLNNGIQYSDMPTVTMNFKRNSGLRNTIDSKIKWKHEILIH